MTITISSSKSTINYALPTRAKKNKVREKEKITLLAVMLLPLDLLWSCKSSCSYLFPHVVVFSATIIIESQKEVIMPCTAKTENNTNANILEAELFF